PSLGFALKGPAKLFKIVPDDFVDSLWLLNEGQPRMVGIKRSTNPSQTVCPSLRSPKSNRLLEGATSSAIRSVAHRYVAYDLPQREIRAGLKNEAITHILAKSNT
ncbi:MAG: hypothetical protein ABFS45_13975, partial [Pseudomonadota bacterium]